MNRIEDQLTSAAEEARHQVSHVQTRPAAAVRTRMYRHRALTGAAVAIGLFGLLGATALVTNTDLTTDMAASPGSTAAVTTTVAPPVESVESASLATATGTRVLGAPGQPVDITDLVYLASVSTGPPDPLHDSVADYDLDGVWDGNPARPRPDSRGDEAELFAFDVTYLIDDDLGSVWIDGGQRGVESEFMFAFESYVAISHVVIYPVSDEEQFQRYYRVQGYEIPIEVATSDPEGLPRFKVAGRLVDSTTPQQIDVGSPTTETLMLSVTSTYPIETAGELPPTDDLAIAEIRIFGWTVDDPDLPRLWSEPTTTALITQSVNVDVFPKVGVCVNPDDGTVIPSRDSVVLDGPTRETPREALAAFLVEPGESVPSQSLSLSRSAYVEMIKPDGSIGYGYMGGFEYEDFDYYTDFDPTEWGLATLITVTETADGWTVDSWGGSGC